MTTILVPTPSGAVASWTFPSSWGAFARSSPFLEQDSFYNSISTSYGTRDGDWYVFSVNEFATWASARSSW